MQRKIVLQVVLALCLLAGIGTAVFFLFSDKKSGSKGFDNTLERGLALAEGTEYPGLAAVPMDAVMVMCNSSVGSALDMLGDGSAIFRELFIGSGKFTIAPFLDSLRAPEFKKLDGSFIISMHYSRDLEPLVVFTDCKKKELRKKVLALAANCRLEAAQAPDTNGTSVVISTSQSLVAASVRHLQVGESIVDNQKFIATAKLAGGRDAIFFVDKYAPKFAGLFLNKNYSFVGPFFASFADVLAFVPEKKKDGYELEILTSCTDNPVYRIGGISTEESTAAEEVLPAETVFAVAMTTGGIGNYIEKYKNHLDANSKLSGYSDSAEKWARGLDLKEIVKAEVKLGETFAQILCLKTGPKPSADVLLRDTGFANLKEYRTSIVPYAYAGYAAKQFGQLFSIPEESFFFYRDNWLVIGDNKTLTELIVGDQEPLADALSKEGIKLSDSPVVYYDIAANLDRLADVFSKDRLVPAISRTLAGATGEILAVSGNEATVRRTAMAKSKSKADPSAVKVPTGPFTVLNSNTGKNNTLTQKADNSLEFKDEKGAVSWTKPFPGKLCGMVSEIDYYNNKRIQYLVASGTKIYLIDRLGRIVKDFPAELGKEVLLGPATYDFSGAHGYSALVLHVDNTIGLYDIHGRVRQGWKGIAPPEQIVELPELVEVAGKKYWKVTTVSRVYTYPFNGGAEPITKEKRKK